MLYGYPISFSFSPKLISSDEILLCAPALTNPNNALSDWLLRDVLKLKEGELLSYERLDILGIDSVRITKIDNLNFKIDFAKINSYEDFINEKT